jgi:hypothetical protein
MQNPDWMLKAFWLAWVSLALAAGSVYVATKARTA